MLQKIKESAKFIKEKTVCNPEVGIILGTWLGGLVSEINVEYTISYKDIPYFATSTVEGHFGKLIFGKLGGKEVIAMQGRFHFYEGYSIQEVTFPVRVMKLLGIKNLILSSVVNPELFNLPADNIFISHSHIIVIYSTNI